MTDTKPNQSPDQPNRRTTTQALPLPSHPHLGPPLRLTRPARRALLLLPPHHPPPRTPPPRSPPRPRRLRAARHRRPRRRPVRPRPVLARIATDQLDHKRSGRLLYGLFIASRNLLPPTPPRRRPHRQPRLPPSSLDSAGSAAADNSNHPDDIVEELVRDSDLGPIAPIAELPRPTDPAAAAEDRRRSLASLLDNLFPPNPTPIPDPTHAGAPSPHPQSYNDNH